MMAHVVLQDAGNIVALAVDDVRRLIFWANNARHWRAIYRAEISGGSQTPIITSGLVSRDITHSSSTLQPHQRAQTHAPHVHIT